MPKFSIAHLPIAYETNRQQADQQVNGFSNNIFKGYTEKDGGRVKAEEDYLRYAQSNPSTGAQVRTPLIKQNAKKKERPPSWETERNVHSKARCTDHNSVLAEGSASQIFGQGYAKICYLRKRQTTLVSREIVGTVGQITNPPDWFHPALTLFGIWEKVVTH